MDIALGAVMSSTSAALIVSDVRKPDYPIVFVNAAFSALTGYRLDQVLGLNPRFMQGVDTDLSVAAELREAILAGVPIRREILNYRQNGEPFWNDLRLDPIRDPEGLLVGYVGVQYDSTPFRLAREAHLATEDRLQNITSHLPGYFYRRVMRPDGIVELPYLSPSVNRFLGIAEGPTVTADVFFSHIHPDDKANLFQAFRQSAADLSVFREEYRLVSADGQIRWFRSDAEARLFPNGDVVWDGIAIEITAEKTSATELAFLAFHDSVTGLSNRELFKTRLLAALNAPAAVDAQVGIFFLDLDAFQEINDGLGPTVGDEVLRSVGQRLTDFLGKREGAVSRLGGDEFALLLASVAMGQSLSDLAGQICEMVARPIRIGGQDIVIQACVGVAACGHGLDATPEAVAEIMKQADLALHAAKRAGHGSHRLYTADLDDRLQNQMALRQALPHTLAGGQLRLHYQPLVDLRSGRIVGAEALVRWQHPELGLVRPDLFIPLAEVSGFIVPLGAWVVREAMRQAQAWKAQGLGALRISINVSSVQLKKPGFVEVVQQALVETGANPKDFEFELTEGLLIEPSPEILAILSALKALGFWIVIDDFGTGHATFKYLRDFPIDKLKIDQIFVRQLVIDSSDAFIIRAIVALSRSLGIEILAEGIETEMQLEFLKGEGCETGQGYLFSMPLVPEDFGWMLENRVSLPRQRHGT